VIDDALEGALLERGLSNQAAHRTASGLERVSGVLRDLAGRRAPTPPARYFVPGRIEVLGKHTDYAGGRSLLATAERGFVIAARARDEDLVRVVAAADGSVVEMRLAPDASASGPSWATYASAVVRRIARNFGAARRGADIVFASDLPAAAGLSSSSALVVAIYLALADLNGLDAAPEYRAEIAGPEDLAGYLATIENGLDFGRLRGDRGVGTFGGSEDHTAILCCGPGALEQYAFCPVRHERRVALPPGLLFVVAASGVVAEKTGAAREAYNRASLAARRVLELWRQASGSEAATLAEACGATAGAVDRIRAVVRRAGDRDFGPACLLDRLDQFVAESREIVPAAAEALARGDLARFGALADRSQAEAEAKLGNQVPETRSLARLARELGAEAASAFGAGFGGSVWALVPAETSAGFSDAWRAAYAAVHPERSAAATFFVTRPGPGALRV